MLPKSVTDSGAPVAFIGTLGSGLTWGGSIVVNPLLSRVEGKKFLGLEGRRCITTLGVLLMSLGFGLATLGTLAIHSPATNSHQLEDCAQTGFRFQCCSSVSLGWW